jgi:hypothetical protein
MQIGKGENPELVLNCDGGRWKLDSKVILTLVDPGRQNVAISVTENEKDAFTIMATVSFARQKLSLDILAKGATIRCDATQLGDFGEAASVDSSSGRMAREIMIRSHGWLREGLNNRNGTRGFITF